MARWHPSKNEWYVNFQFSWTEFFQVTGNTLLTGRLPYYFSKGPYSEPHHETISVSFWSTHSRILLATSPDAFAEINESLTCVVINETHYLFWAQVPLPRFQSNSHCQKLTFMNDSFLGSRVQTSKVFFLKIEPKVGNAISPWVDKASTETCRLLFIYNFIASIGEYEQSVTHATSYESRFADRSLSYHDRATWRSSCTFGLDARYAWCVTLLRMVLGNLPKSCPEVNCMRPRNFNASAVESSPDRRISLMVDGMSVFLLTLCYLSKL